MIGRPTEFLAVEIRRQYCRFVRSTLHDRFCLAWIDVECLSKGVAALKTESRHSKQAFRLTRDSSLAIKQGRDSRYLGVIENRCACPLDSSHPDLRDLQCRSTRPRYRLDRTVDRPSLGDERIQSDLPRVTLRYGVGRQESELS